MREPLKLILRIFIRLCIVLVCLLVTTYGWAAETEENVGSVEMKEQIQKNLERTVVHLSETIGIRNYDYYENLNLSADYIISQFKGLGYQVEIMSYIVEGKEYKNIIAKQKNEKEDVIIFGAHYDSCFNPGADDNASGVAGVIELARLLKNYEGKDSIRFIAFVNEEPPFFQTDNMGSLVYAEQMKENKENIEAAIILEMIGYFTEERNSQRYPPLLGLFYPNKGDFIAVVGNLKSRRFVKNIVGPFKKSVNLPIRSIVAPEFVPGLNFSDHWSFWRNGFPAVMVTDTAYLRNKHYHRQTDTPETLNYNKMTDVVLGLNEVIINGSKKK